MTDREKIISEIEEEIRLGEHWDECYRTVDLQLLRDILALLKEQEPVAHAAWLGKETSTAYDLYGVKTWAAKYKCSKCGFTHRAIEAHMCYSYCPSCGAKMDEEIGAEEE